MLAHTFHFLAGSLGLLGLLGFVEREVKVARTLERVAFCDRICGQHPVRGDGNVYGVFLAGAG